MDNTNRMTVTVENGEEKEVKILFTFDTPDGRTFALFTPLDDTEGAVYAYQYDEDGNMESVTDEKDWEMCEEMFNTFMDNEGFENEG